MNKRCPVCREYTIDSVPRVELINAGWHSDRDLLFKQGYISYACTNCGWQSGYDTVRRLRKLGRSTEPDVVYLVQLVSLAAKRFQTTSYKHRRIYCNDTGYDMVLEEGE